MTSLTLYAIADQYLADIEKLQDMELDEQTLTDTLEGLSGELEVKATNVGMFIRNLESSAEQIKMAEKQMADRRKALEARAERVKQYLKENMIRTGISKIESPYFTLSIRNNPEAVEVINQDMIPPEYFNVPPPPPATLDKIAVKKAIQSGVEVDGVRLTRSQSLQIK